MPSYFVPRCPSPRGLELPVPVDATGLGGPTPGQARGPYWRRTSPGRYVPADTGTSVEQRILEQAQRLPPEGAVGGWASLRLHGAAYFDGLGADGRAVPVPLVVPAAGPRLRVLPGSRVLRRRTPPRVVTRHAVPCVEAADAVLEVAHECADIVEAVIAIDMALVASIVTLEQLRAATGAAAGSRGVHRTRAALALVDPRSRSPQESWMRCVWVLWARLPPPRCNWLVADLDGRVLGSPDLLDPGLGLVGEYDGSAHLAVSRRRRDVEREARFRAVGLEVVTALGRRPGDEHALAVRLREAAERARSSAQPRRYQVREGPRPGW